MKIVKSIVYLVIFCAIWYLANRVFTYNLPTDEGLHSLKFSVSFGGASLICAFWFAFSIARKWLGYLSVVLFSLIVWVLAAPGFSMAPDSGGEVMVAILWVETIAAIFPLFLFRYRLKTRQKIEKSIPESSGHSNKSNKNSVLSGAAVVGEIADTIEQAEADKPDSDGKLFDD